MSQEGKLEVSEQHQAPEIQKPSELLGAAMTEAKAQVGRKDNGLGARDLCPTGSRPSQCPR